MRGIFVVQCFSNIGLSYRRLTTHTSIIHTFQVGVGSVAAFALSTSIVAGMAFYQVWMECVIRHLLTKKHQRCLVLGSCPLNPPHILRHGFIFLLLLQGTAYPLPLFPNWDKLGDSPVKIGASLLAIAPVLLNSDICHQSVFPCESEGEAPEAMELPITTECRILDS